MENIKFYGEAGSTGQRGGSSPFSFCYQIRVMHTHVDAGRVALARPPEEAAGDKSLLMWPPGVAARRSHSFSSSSGQFSPF